MRILLAGASGSVGSSLRKALTDQEHDILPVTFREGAQAPTGLVDFPSAIDALRRGEVDAIVNASGPGDHRLRPRDVTPFSHTLAREASRAGIPAVLISTLRVCEGDDILRGDDQLPNVTSPYAAANVANEKAWMAGETAIVLRLSNFFCVPDSPEAHQCQLLPWSLLLEGWQTGQIGVRSGPAASKEFISAADAARAVVEVIAARTFGHSLATLPGAAFTMQDLASISSSVLRSLGRESLVTFGADTPPTRRDSRGSWLSSRGWKSELSMALMQRLMLEWLVEWAARLPVIDTLKES